MLGDDGLRNVVQELAAVHSEHQPELSRSDVYQDHLSGILVDYLNLFVSH